MRKLSGRKIINLFALLIVVTVLAGCTTTPETSQPDSQNQEITLQWWGVFLDESVVQPLLDDYHTLHPNITVDYANRWPGGEWETGAALYQSELNRVLKENNPVVVPDIFMVDNSWAGNYEAYASSAPASVTDAATVAAAFYPAITSDFVNDTSVYGLPLWMDDLVILYNKSLLTAASVTSPPTNWVDFKSLAISLTKRDSGTITQAGFAAGVADNVTFGPELLNVLFLQNGVAITNSLGDVIFSADTDSVTALDFYKSFSQSGGSWDASFENDALAFMQGKLAMLLSTSWRYADILRFNEKYKLNLNIGVAALPQLQGQNPPVINWATYWGNMVALGRPNKTAAWEFLQWITEPEQLRKLSQNVKSDRNFFGLLYPRQDMQQELASDQYLRTFNAGLPLAESWDMIDGLAVRSEFNKLIAKTSISQSSIADTENAIQRIISSKGQL
ncbi:extracellular solute-binding protein [Candidatus Dojkabacteria bacterium]|uniref:Extracellular solute-binding protein n=1 Tax=Candidatus Dojkabacteria bacterium TaxID=2099670 RepID=A0A955I4D5_9BACT|nr:extracellular solute-binding protein [Candidatus Dojkabacteria bacterium]